MLFAQGVGGLGTADWIKIGVLGAFLFVWFTVQVLYLLTLHTCLKRIHPRNRTMQPAMVWLNLIPCFNLIWRFITVIRVSESLASEFQDREADYGSVDYAKGIGIAYMVCTVMSNVPFLDLFATIPALVLWIIYWVKVAGFSRQLEEMGGTDYDDYDYSPD